MDWIVEFHDEFEVEYRGFNESIQDALIEEAKFLALFGPSLGRPQVDTLKDSRHANMKELRFRADGGVWRVAFAFDPERKAILLVAGNKAGKSQTRFYKQLIQKADERFSQHIEGLKKSEKRRSNNG
jgi:hypothetical protein